MSGAAWGALTALAGLRPIFAPGWWLGVAGAHAIVAGRVRNWESINHETLYTTPSRATDGPSHFRAPARAGGQ